MTLGRPIHALAALLVAIAAPRPAQSIADYITFDFRNKRVDSAAVYALSLGDARLVRGTFGPRRSLDSLPLGVAHLHRKDAPPQRTAA